MAETQVTIKVDRKAYQRFKAGCILRQTSPYKEFRRFLDERLEEWNDPQPLPVTTERNHDGHGN